jgi:hypothetical protein
MQDEQTGAGAESFEVTVHALPDEAKSKPE